ncbi:MAG TPA: RND family transporter [Treponema sp.]|nr:RND family transporter [Treponema sp.]
MEKFFKRPWLIMGIMLAITVFFALQLVNVEIDNNNYRFIPADNPARVTAERINDLFGNHVTVLVGLERKYGTVFDPDFLARLRDYDAEVSMLPLVGESLSLISTDYITGKDGAIIMEPLVPEDFSGSPDEIAAIKKRILSWDMYDNMLVSQDFSSTQIVVSLDVEGDDAGSPETLAVFREIRALANDYFGGADTTVYITGLPVFSLAINESVMKDLFFLVPLVVLVVLLILFFSFRRAFAVIVPIITVLVATIWSVGAMPLFGIKMSVLTTVLPVILIAVGSAYGIHVVSHYIDDRERAKLIDADAHRDLVFSLVRRVGKPVFLAALTTFVGFVSFCFTSVIPIREFGFFSSFGVIVSFLVAVTFIPALFLARGPVPLKPRRQFFRSDDEETAGQEIQDPLSKAITTSFMALVRGKRKVVLLTALLIAVSIAFIPRIVVDNVLVEYFKADTDMARSDGFIRKKFGGSKLVSVVVESPTPGGVLEPEVLVAMDGLVKHLETNVPEVGKVTSFTHLLKRINQVYNVDEDPSGIGLVKQQPLQTESFSSDDDFGFGFGDFGSFDEPASNDYETEADSEIKVHTGMSINSVSDLAKAFDAALLLADERQPPVQDFVRGVRRAVNHEGAAYYEIPADPARYGQADMAGLRNVVSNYMMLLSGDIKAFADDPLEPRAIKMNVQLRTIGQIDTDRAIREIEDYAAVQFPKNVTVTVGGFALVEGALNRLVVQSQLISIIISLVMVFLIISISYRSAMAGAISIVPLSLSILLNFAVMAFLGIKLNIGTALVGSVAIGIGVDYIIHYLAAYYREWQISKEGFLARAYGSSGKAIMINAISVGAGFGVLALSEFNILAQFGLLVALTMATASLSALIVLPVLLNWLKPNFLNKGKK